MEAERTFKSLTLFSEAGQVIALGKEVAVVDSVCLVDVFADTTINVIVKFDIGILFVGDTERAVIRIRD